MPENIHLQKYPLFNGLSEKELELLVPHLLKRSFAKGVYLFFPESPSFNTFLVESGLVRLFFTNLHGEEYLLNLVRPGGAFGLPVLQGENTRLMGAAAYKDSIVFSIESQKLLQFIPVIPQLACNLYREASTSARMLLVHVRALVTLPLTARLAFLLVRISQVWQMGDNIIMPLNQAELAGWLGASRGRLNRALNELQKQELIELRDARIIILNRPGLERLIRTGT